MRDVTLTDEQRKFAEVNHNLIYAFLNNHKLPMDDWYGAAALGFCKAVVKYDPERTKQFSTFAFFVMLSEVRQIMRRERNREGRLTVVSLDSPVGDGSLTLGDVVGTDQDFMPDVELRAEVAAAIHSLTAEEKQLIGFLQEGLKQKAIAKMLGISRALVSRRIKKIRTKFIDALYLQEGDADEL